MQIDFKTPSQTPAPAQESPVRGWDGPEGLSIPVPFLGRSVGLGEAIARGLKAMGARPCGGCQQRADAIDRAAKFVPWD